MGHQVRSRTALTLTYSQTSFAALAIGLGLLVWFRFGARGFALNYRSDYLKRRNWIQIALMGECSREKVRRLLAAWDDARQRFSNT